MAIQNQQLADLINQMAHIDQDIRKNASGAFSGANYLVYLADAVHEYRLRRIIQEYGYPSEEMIGAEAMRSFWLLVQHQDFDPKLQEDCLQHCNFAPKEKAYLTDRVRMNAGKMQVFGTQFTRKEGKLVPHPIEDESNVEARRSEVGLDSLEDYTKRMNKET